MAHICTNLEGLHTEVVDDLVASRQHSLEEATTIYQER